MNAEFTPDWDPDSGEVCRDQRAAYDKMRDHCPVAYSKSMQWTLFRHEDISRVLNDHETFSSVVSQHLSVPNGMDPPEHTNYRRLIEPYFSQERITAFEPACREIAADLVQDVLGLRQVEMMAEFALPFAVRVQCSFLGWPPELHEPLINWISKNQAATYSQNRKTMLEVALEFESFINKMLEIRIQSGAKPESDVTASLMHEKVNALSLNKAEIASILRNWTAGEIGTISAAVGILAQYLALHGTIQQKLRTQPELLPTAIDEILRIHGPLVANRRRALRPVEIGERKINAGERIYLNWISGNRDGHIFEEPDTFRLDRDVTKNLLYGAGIHVCPGAPLARMELKIIMDSLLQATNRIQLVQGKPPTNAIYPSSGFATLPLEIS
ncbi:MAG: cytochrome P450 [Gallionella sp.]